MRKIEDNRTLSKKISDVFVRLAGGIAVSSVILSALVVFGSCQINAFLIGMSLLLGVPTTYGLLTVARSLIHKNYVQDMHMYEQFTRGMKEFNEDELVDHKEVTEDMAVFYSFIQRRDTEHKISQESYNAINSFLFMVNENYYEEIAVDNYANLSRTKLIEMLVSIIVSELRENELFDDIVAEDVLKRAFFIKEEVKDEMIKEFFESKSRLLGKPAIYKIISKKVSLKAIESLLEKEKEEKKNLEQYPFDINNVEDYEELLNDMSEMNENPYGDFSKIDIDFELIMSVVQMIDELYSEEFEEKYEDYCIERLAASLLYDVAIYASVNNKNEVGMQEILNTMKNWYYLDYMDKVAIVNSIFEEYKNMEGITNPFTEKIYITKKEDKPQCKIIEFNPNKFNK